MTLHSLLTRWVLIVTSSVIAVAATQLFIARSFADPADALSNPKAPPAAQRIEPANGMRTYTRSL